MLKAAERMAWASGVHARSQVRAQTSVEAELTRIKEQQQFGERPASNDLPDRPDMLPRSAWVAALHRAFGCQKPAGSVDNKQWMTKRRPEDQAPREYLHVLLCDRPTQSVRDVVKRAIQRHGWSGGVARHAQLTMERVRLVRSIA